MKKLIFLLSLYFLSCSYGYTKEIYVDASSNEKYLFLGITSYNYNKKVDEKKLLSLSDSQITWIDKDKLQQVGEMIPEDFLKEIFKNKLYFDATGSTPHWQANISDQRLEITLPSGNVRKRIIQITIDKNPLDGVFLLAFQSEDLQTFGIIRMLSGDVACTIDNDGETYFEVFINSQGEIVKGCARLEKRSTN